MANGNGLPKPDPLWIALGIAIAATAEGLGEKRRRRFFRALRSLVDEHEGNSRVVVFGTRRNRDDTLPRSIRVASKWLRRLVAELDDGVGR